MGTLVHCGCLPCWQCMFPLEYFVLFANFFPQFTRFLVSNMVNETVVIFYERPFFRIILAIRIAGSIPAISTKVTSRNPFLLYFPSGTLNLMKKFVSIIKGGTRETKMTMTRRKRRLMWIYLRTRSTRNVNVELRIAEVKTPLCLLAPILNLLSQGVMFN